MPTPTIPTTFIRAGRDVFALKLMATIVLPNSKEIDWAIFFGVKPAAPPAGAVIGALKDGANDVACSPVHPLWLVPLSKKAMDEAQRVRGLRSVPGPKAVPNIRTMGLTIRNRRAEQENSDWHAYLSWYPDQTDWSTDPLLYVGNSGTLTKLSDKGDWYDLSVDGQVKSAVWVTTAKIPDSERVFFFSAPACQLVTPNGTYVQHTIWLGLTTCEDGNRGECPCVTISQSLDNDSTSDACVIRFDEKLRIDTFFDIVSAPTDPTSEAKITADQWKTPQTLFQAHDPGDEGNISIQIRDDFADNGYIEQTLKQWLVQERLKNGNIIQNFLIPAYFRLYILSDMHGSLFNLLGAKHGQSDPQVIHNFQLSRPDGIHIFTAIRYVGSPQIDTLWNGPASSLRNALEWLTAAAPVGIVPQIGNFSNKNYRVVSEWQTGYAGCSQTAASFTLFSSFFYDEEGNPAAEKWDITLPKLRAQHYSPPLDGQSDVTNNNNIVLQGSKLKVSNIVTSVQSAAVNDDGTVLQWLLKSYTLNADNIQLRDGALAFALDSKSFDDSPAALPANLYGRFRVTLQLVKTQQPFYLWQWYSGLDTIDKIQAFYAIEDFSLPVTKVEAAGQDMLPQDLLLAPPGVGAVVEGFGERTEPALVIPLTTAPDGKKYLLTLAESINCGQNYLIDVRLQVYNPTAGNDNSTTVKAVVIDTSPQIVSLVHAQFLQQPGYDEGAWILARRSSFSIDDGGWELLNDNASTQGFFLVLPSQGIGEAYVRGQVMQRDETMATGAGEPVEGQPIDYRFGAPAVLRLAPEKLDTRYVSAPWNLRRIWGQAGDAAAGAPLLEAQFELLYGMMAHLQPDNVLLAELGARLGEIPVPPVNTVVWAPTNDQQSAFRDAWQYYLQFYRAWKSRLAVLEPGSAGSNGTRVYNSTTDDLHFNLRVALTKQMVSPPGGQGSGLPVFQGCFTKTAGADLRHPMTDFKYGPQLPNTNGNPSADEVFNNEARATHSQTGLAGGAVYGFESDVIYNEFLQAVYAGGSSSGEVQDLAFSALGGWGKQTARFAADKTIIKSNVTMGRTHYYAVERIGRIGVFWNKAKHVIEYQRTVVPSRQFMGLEPAHPGRPLVRKVREYIEILEPVKNYPDHAGDPAEAPGSVSSITFKSIIIPVLSSWGHDVNTKDGVVGAFTVTPIGWEVPLWKQGADPIVYPKPQVVLSLLPPADSDGIAIDQNLSEPQNLWFYTDTRPSAPDASGKTISITANNTSDWPAVQEVDYTGLPVPPPYDIDPAVDDSIAGLSAPMPDALDIPPGFERFTFRVDGNEKPASVAGRYYPNSGMTGSMRTVSMLRGSTTQATPGASTLKEYNTLTQLVYGNDSLLARAANGFQDLNKQICNGVIPKADDYINKINTDLNSGGLPGLLGSLSAGVAAPGVCHYIDGGRLWGYANAFCFPTKYLWREALEMGDGLVGRALQYYSSLEDQLLATWNDDIAAAVKQGSTALDTAKAIFDRYAATFTTFRADTQLTADGAVSKVQGLIDHFADSAGSKVNAAFQDLNDFVGQLDPTTTLDTVKTQFLPRIGSGLDTLQTDTIAVLDNLATAKPDWQPTTDALKATLKGLYTGCKTDLQDVVNDVQNVTNFLSLVINGIRNTTADYNNRLQNALSSLDSLAKQPLNDLQKAYAALDCQWTNLETSFLKTIRDGISALESQLHTDADATTKFAADGLDNIKKALQNTLVTTITPILYTDPGTSVFTALRTLDGVLQAVENAVQSDLVKVFQGLSNDASALAKWVGDLDAFKRLQAVIAQGAGAATSILNAATDLANTLNQKYGALASTVAQQAKDAILVAQSGEGAVQSMSATLTNYRSVWDQFTAPGMGLNRKTVAMLVRTDWKNVEERLSLTPCIARVKQFGQQLEGLGLRLPVAAIADKLLPAGTDWNGMQKSLMSNFGFSNLMSDLGGMRFDNLFPGFKMPDFARDNIKITQGFDKQNLTAWVNAETDVKISDTLTVLSLGPLQVELEKGEFVGQMRLSVDIDGKMNKTDSGKLTGSWHVIIAGLELMIFRDAGIIFQDGKLTFDMDPKRMEMSGLLQLLADATENISGGGDDDDDDDDDGGSVFKLGLVKVGEIPAGVRATLDIPPISIGGGPTAITNLSFGGFFQLLVLDPQLQFKFVVGIGFYVGKEEAPFNITIFIFGGGGFVNFKLDYAPSDPGGPNIDFVMSMDASVSLAIAAGFMTGYVAIMIGFQGEYHRIGNAGSSVYVTIFIRVVGMIDLLSIVSVMLYLDLEATYQISGNNSSLVGTGRVKLEIRICRFFTVKVDQSYTKQFTGSGSSQSTTTRKLAPAASPDPSLRAQKILSSLA